MERASYHHMLIVCAAREESSQKSLMVWVVPASSGQLTYGHTEQANQIKTQSIKQGLTWNNKEISLHGNEQNHWSTA